jgi:hypothetical protein
MERRERDFLTGFERAALLVRQILTLPPSYATREGYVADVARLHGDADDLVRRGLAVGCLAALGRG